MKSFSSMLLTALMTFCTMAAPLTQADLEELRERLNNIEKAALSQQDLRYKKAMDDFREALRSDDAAVDLYLRCVEKVNFIEQQKKGQDFRNWKRDHEEQHKDGNFRQALRSQLLWLSLTARAAARPDEIEKLAPEANEAIKAIFAQADRLASQRDLLSRSVLESIFARAYNMDEIKIEAWPLSPLQVDAIYDRVRTIKWNCSPLLGMHACKWKAQKSPSLQPMLASKIRFLDAKILHPAWCDFVQKPCLRYSGVSRSISFNAAINVARRCAC
jgi:hypothetical protein